MVLFKDDLQLLMYSWIGSSNCLEMLEATLIGISGCLGISKAKGVALEINESWNRSKSVVT